MRQKKIISSKFLVLGHRGSPKKEIENTIRSFERALEDGADGVELDVHLSKDDYLVVSHDSNLKRVFGSNGIIENMTLDEIKGVSSDIPTLDEVFKALGPVYYDIEIKAEMDLDPKLIDKVSQTLQSFPSFKEKIAVSSFNPLAMKKFSRENKGTYPLGIIYDPKIPFMLRKGEGRFFFPCDFLKPRWDIAEKSGIKHPEYSILPWCVDTEEELEPLLKLKNLQGFISNVPGEMIEVLKKKGLRD